MNEEIATTGKTHTGRSFEFRNGKWKIYDENNEIIDGIELPTYCVTNTKKIEAED